MKPRHIITVAIDESTVLRVESLPVKIAMQHNMLAKIEATEANLITSYLPNLTSASQPIKGAKEYEKNTCCSKKILLLLLWHALFVFSLILYILSNLIPSPDNIVYSTSVFFHILLLL